MIPQTLIVLDKPVGFYHAGKTLITDAEWAATYDLPMKVCCSQLTAIFLYGKISANDFRYCLSRMRGPIEHIEKRSDKGCVFVNREGIWFGGDRVLDLVETPEVTKEDIVRVVQQYEQYWENLGI